jgi:mannan endo-1,4-beta-mannosidase
MKRSLTLLTALLLAPLAVLPATEQVASRFQHFITRQGDKLMEGDKEFRFIGANMPGLSLPYDFTLNLPERMTLPTPWEQEDGLKTLDQMNLRVVRLWTVPIREPHDTPPDGGMTWHCVQGPGRFNEASFKVLDSLLALANRHGIRVVFSLSCCWRYQVGGIETYLAHRNKKGKALFFTDPQVKEDFKQTVRHVLTRRNTVSGVPYKEDKAILCWELGNELWDVPYEVFAPWQSELAAFIKSLDPNHLIMDARANVIPKEPDPNVDIFNMHYYGNDFAASCRSHQAQSRGRRPFVIGEFGPYDGKGFTPDKVVEKTREFMNAVQESGTAGTLLWSMYFHHRDGGFYWHQIMTYPAVWAYHWPGFPSAEAQREIGVLGVMREAAFQIQGLPVPTVPLPDAPELLPIGDAPLLSWRGSAGASGYDVERAPGADGPWTRIADNVSDAAVAYRPLFSDTTARAGETYFYRVAARNASGVSKPSNSVGPVAVKRVCLADELQDFSRVHAKSGGLTLDNDYNALYAEYLFRAKGNTNDWLSYNVAAPLESVKVVAFYAKDMTDLTLHVSADGVTFRDLRPTRKERRLGSPHAGPARGQRRTLVEYECAVPAGNRNLKVQWNGPAELDRVEIYHDQ